MLVVLGETDSIKVVREIAGIPMFVNPLFRCCLCSLTLEYYMGSM